MDIPHDRTGEFEPKIIPKYQRDISGIEEKVISLYARGNLSCFVMYWELLSKYAVSKIPAFRITLRKWSSMADDRWVDRIVNDVMLDIRVL